MNPESVLPPPLAEPDYYSCSITPLFPHFHLYGNLTLIKMWNDGLVAEAESSSRDPGTVARALIGLGIVSFLQGNLSSSIDHFERARALDLSDRVLQLRCVNWIWHATYTKYLGHPTGLVWQSRYGGEIEMALHQRLQNRPAHRYLLNDDVRLEDILFDRLVHLAAAPSPSLGGDQAITAIFNIRNQCLQIGAAKSILAALDIELSKLQFFAGNCSEARHRLNSALQIFEEIEDQNGVAACRVIEGDWLVAPLSSPDVWGTSVSEVGEGNDGPESALDEPEVTVPSIRRARLLYGTAVALYSMNCELRGVGLTRLRLAYLFGLENEFESALREAQLALIMFGKAGDLCRVNLARAHAALYHFRLGHLQEGLSSAPEIGQGGLKSGSLAYTIGIATFIIRVAWRWITLEGRVEPALICFRYAELLCQSAGDRISQSKASLQAGIASKTFGSVDGALLAFERAFESLQAFGMDQGQLGKCPDHTPMLQLARDMCTLALQRVHPDEMERMAAFGARVLTLFPSNASPNLTTLLGNLLQNPRTPNTSSAQEGVVSALHVVPTQLLKREIHLLRFLALLYRGRHELKNGNEDAALVYFTRADEQLKATPSDLRAPMHTEFLIPTFRRDYGKALELYRDYANRSHTSIRQAVSFGPEMIRHHAIHNSHLQALEVFVKLQAYHDADSQIQAIEELSGKNWWKSDSQSWRIARYLGEVREEQGKFEEAFSIYEHGATEFENRRITLRTVEMRSSTANDPVLQELFFGLARTAIKMLENRVSDAKSMLELAFKAVERSKARSLLDMLAYNLLQAGGERDTNLNVLRRAHAELAVYQNVLAGCMENAGCTSTRREYLKKKVEAAEESVLAAEKTFKEIAATRNLEWWSQNPYLAADSISSLSDVANKIPADTVLLQYAHNESEMLAWAITSEGISALERLKLSVGLIERTIRTFRSAILNRTDAWKAAEDLSSIFLYPFRDVILHHKNIIIVPYGAAHNLQFGALAWEGRPLAMSHAISYLPSASAMKYLSDPIFFAPQSETKPVVLSVGNPSCMSWARVGEQSVKPLKELPAAGVEAEYVASLLEGESFQQEEATLDSVFGTLQKVSTEEGLETIHRKPLILHFATHGIVNPEEPLATSLALANGQLLTMYDLVGLRVPIDLVVLSACNSGYGEATFGDETFGLVRALLASGAKSVLVSLWPVDDACAAVFMGELYRRIRRGASVRNAVHNAQRFIYGLSHDQLIEELEKMKDFSRKSKTDTLSADSRRIKPSRQSQRIDNEQSKQSSYDRN